MFHFYLFHFFGFSFCNNLIYCILRLTTSHFCCCIAVAAATVLCVFVIIFYSYLYLYLYLFIWLIYFLILHIIIIYFATALGLCLCHSQQLPPPIFLYNFAYSGAIFLAWVHLVWNVKWEMRLPSSEIAEINAVIRGNPIESHLNYLTFAHLHEEAWTLNKSWKINLNVFLMNVYSAHIFYMEYK